MEFAVVNYIYNTEKRKRRHKKLQKRRNTIMMTNEPLAKSKKFARLASIESVYNSTISTISEFNGRISDFSRRKSSVDLEPTIDLTKRRRSSVTINLPKPMPHIKEEPSGRNTRKASMFSTTTLVTDFKLTPEELANEIDRRCRRYFPLAFLVFNFFYWIILQVKF